MKGILVYSPNKQNWIVEYKEDGRDVFLEVRPNRIDDLNSVGTHLQNMTEVDFKIENTHEFPYRWAVPYVEKGDETISISKKKTIKKKRITLWLTGFHTDEIDIECQGYDCSSTGSGYWYFFDRDKNDSKIYIGAYPMDRTCIHQIEEIEVEI